MRLKNVLIVVNDIERSKNFYKDLFGLQVLMDFGKNVILTEGLVLQEKDEWETLIGEEVAFGGKAMELYFEERDLQRFIEKLEESPYDVKILNPLVEEPGGRRVIRLYDPDMHVIEIAEAVRY